MKLLPIALSGLLLAPLAAESPAPTRIHVSASASAGGDGTSWATAFSSLQDALAAATGTVGDDEIWIAAGTYTPDPGGSDQNLRFQLASGVAIYGGFDGSETQLGDRNPNPLTNDTILSGDLAGDDGPDFTNRSDNSSRVVDGTGSDNTAILDGVTIRGGNAGYNGGGFGGGSPTFVGCLFTDNQAANAGGGATISFGTTPSFTDCHFIGNKAGFYGGALDCYAAPVPFLRCTFEENRSGLQGGAVMNFASAATYSFCSFRANVASNGSNGSGGALYIRAESPPLLHNCEIIGNMAEYGGGIYLLDADPALTNVTVSGNRATTVGGGFYCGFQPSAPSLTNCLVWNNSSAGSAGTIESTIVVGTSTPTFSHSIVHHSGGSASWNAAAGNDGGSNLDADPLFNTAVDPLTAPTTTGAFGPGAGSPAIDAGLDTADLDGSGPGTDTIASVGTDLAGNPRFEGNTIDIGAYEYFEGSVATTFASLFPALEPGGDENGNGLTNFTDYALGADPSAPHDPSAMPLLTGGSITFSHRGGASDVDPVYKKSSTLGGWVAMQPGIDYTVISSLPDGDRIVVTLDLLIDSETHPRMFFIQEFAEP